MRPGCLGPQIVQKAPGLRTNEMSKDKWSLTVRHIEANTYLVLIVDRVGRTSLPIVDVTSSYYGSN